MRERVNAGFLGTVLVAASVAAGAQTATEPGRVFVQAESGGSVQVQPEVSVQAQPGVVVKPFVYAVDATLDYVSGERLNGPVVRGAPYSGEGLTTVTQTLSDGTHIERVTTARLYRDSEGRTRREQTLLGLGDLSPSGEAPTSITIMDPVAGVSYVLEPNSRKARRLPNVSNVYAGARRQQPSTPPPAPGTGSVVVLGKLAPPPPPLPPPPPTGESLGTAKMEGLDVVGQRMTAKIEVGRIGNDRPIDVVDERWESPALKVLVMSRHHDPRTGDVEYRLTNINRAEPSHDLFVVPSDYTVVDARDDENSLFVTKKMLRDPNGAVIKKPQD